MLKNDLILRVARGEPTERTPVWLMRQAGRILKEYRDIRSSVSGFKELVTTPDLAAEVTVQPVDILGVDAAIIFSDILVIPEALGLPYEMVEKIGPRFPRTITSTADLDGLRPVDEAVDTLEYVYEAIAKTRELLQERVPLIGFAGAPWTVFCYMVEGKGSKDFSLARSWLYARSNEAEALLDLITEATISYLKRQIEAGAHIIQLFDSWAGVLAPEHYQRFCIPRLKRLFQELPATVPKIMFAKGAGFALPEITKLPCQVIGLDWHMDPRQPDIKQAEGKAFQGNLDPAALFAKDDQLVQQVNAMMERFKGMRHIANLGHGVYPQTSPEKVRLFVETVKNYAQSS